MLIVLVVRQGVGMIVTLPFKRYRVPLFPKTTKHLLPIFLKQFFSQLLPFFDLRWCHEFKDYIKRMSSNPNTIAAGTNHQACAITESRIVP
jgi:hypothetical protein